MKRLSLAGDYCPKCGAHEAMHPEACDITPAEWRRLARQRMARLERAAKKLEKIQQSATCICGRPCDLCGASASR